MVDDAEHPAAAAAREARAALDEAHASGDAARCESAAASACALACGYAADSAACDALAWELLHSLAGVAEASPCAAERCAALLATLAAGCPPRAALPLFLEALQLSRERSDDGDDGGAEHDAPPLRLRFRAALARGVCALLARAPRRRWRTALDAAPQLLRAAASAAAAAAECGDAPAEGATDDAAEERAAAAEALEAALGFAAVAASAADAEPEPSALGPALPRLLLRLLAAAATKLPRGAADERLAALRDALCARGVAASWDALDAAAAPPCAAASDSDSDGDADADDAAARAREAADAALGAAMLAAALLSGGAAGGDALRGGDALPRAAPHAAALLSGGGGPAAMHAGAQLASAAAGATLAAGAECRASQLQPLLAALAAALARAASPATREAAHAALLRCLDALPPWARLDAVRELLGSARDPAAAALLFRRLKDDAAAHWPRPPLGAAPAARLVADWLRAAAAEGGEALAEAADATVGALNALRFALLRDAAGRSNASGLAAGAAAAELRERTLLPLRAAAADAAAALADEQHPGAMLAAQTVQEVCDCVLQAADAAAAACADADEPSGAATGDAAPPKPVTTGLRRGFLR